MLSLPKKNHNFVAEYGFPQCCSGFSFRRTLADIIMEKITEKQTEVGTVMSEVSGRPMPQLDPRIIEVYKGVNKVSRAPATSCINLLGHLLFST